MVEEKAFHRRRPANRPTLQPSMGPRRPRVVGEFDEAGRILLPNYGELTPAGIARVIAGRIGRFHDSDAMRARLQVPGTQGTLPGAAPKDRRANPLLLLRLPAQHFHAGPGRQPRRRRHRLPLHGHLDVRPPHRHLHPDGRRRRRLDRAGAVHRHAAHLPEPGRRHLQPLGHPGRSRGPGGRRHHDLQDPLQRCRRHDRRPAAWTANSPSRT